MPILAKCVARRRNRRFATHPECSRFKKFLDGTPMPNTTDHIPIHDNLPAGMAVPILLPDEILEFIQSGVSVIVGVVGADGRAQAGRALATRVESDGAFRLMYPADGNAAITASAQSGGPIAVTFSAPLSHRTIQLKAGSSRAEQLDPEDRISVEHQIDAFAAILRVLGFPPPLVKSFCNNRSKSISVLSFVPQAAYEQTPGPGAGREL